MKAPILILLAALALSGCGRPAPSSWEYEEVEWDKDFSSVVIQIDTAKSDAPEKVTCMSAYELLNAMGARHWELASVAGGPDGFAYFFKRPVAGVHEIYLFEAHSKSAAPK